MHITNLAGLPQPLVNAIRGDDYNDGGADITVTELLLPPRLATLRRRHKEEIIEDASERIWSLVGRIGHRILAEGAKNQLAEYRLSIKHCGWVISGQFDVISNDCISDYKFVTAWACKDGPKPEWVQQLNLYRLLCYLEGFTVPEVPTRLEIVAILRDWSKLEARRDRNYPQSGVQIFRLPVWTMEGALTFLANRIHLHQQARQQLPQCTDEEMWIRDHTWAVIKNGNKRATSVQFSEKAATAILEAMNELERKKYRIEFRPGERVRCESYCAVSEFCQQFQDYKKPLLLPPGAA